MARAIYQLLGFGLVALAMIGAVLPVLPSTPFLLLATGCFMRSSPRYCERLLRLPLVGGTLRDWHVHRAVRPGAKRLAFATLAAVGGATLASGRLPLELNMLLVVLLTIGATVVLRLPTRRPA